MFTLDKVVMAIIKQARGPCDSAAVGMLTPGPFTGADDRSGQQMPGAVGAAAVDAETRKCDDPGRDWLPARSGATRWV